MNRMKDHAKSFDVDMESYLSQHEIIYERPGLTWQDSQPLGNGDLAVCVYAPGHLEWGVGKSDVWDGRFAGRGKKFTPHAEIVRLVKENDKEALDKIHREEQQYYENFTYPSPKPCGFVRLKIPAIDIAKACRKKGSFKQTLSLHSAMVTTEIRNPLLNLTARSFVDANSNELLVNIDIAGANDDPMVLELYRLIDPELGTPQFSFEEGMLILDYPFPDGFRYVMGVKPDCPVEQVQVDSDAISVRIPGKTTRLNIRCCVVTSIDEVKPKNELVKKMAASRGFDSVFNKHKKQWASFWNASFISLSDKFLENIYYFQNYALACCSGRHYPASIFTPLCMDLNQRWHGDFHTNCNIEKTYYLSFTSNHLELFKTYAEYYYRILPVVKKQTQETYGFPGAKYPFSSTTTGEEISGGFWRYETYVTAWVVELFWWYYSYTQDKNFLETKAYEVIRECCIFYENYLQKDATGKYYSFPCHVVEHGNEWEKNTTIELAMVKELFMIGVETSRVMGQDEERRNKWQDIVDNLSPFPNNGEQFLSFEGASLDLLVHHPDILSPVFPTGLIGIGSDAEDYRLAKNTFDNIYDRSIRKGKYDHFPFKELPIWQDDLGHGWIIAVAARLGLGEVARNYLCDLLIFQQLKENGFLAFINVSGILSQDKRRDLPWINNNVSFASAALCEMLLQSHEGFIRLFPAVPKDWEVSFGRLRARGAFLITSEYDKGKVMYAIVESEAGQRLKMSNPWPGEKLRVVKHSNDSVRYEDSNSVISFATVKGGKYFIAPENYRLRKGCSRITGKKRNKPRVYEGPRYLDNPPKKWKIYLGAPFETRETTN